MILFARSERHACRQAQDIIGVSPVFPIPAKGDHRKPESQILPAARHHHQKLTPSPRFRMMVSREFRTIALDALLRVAFLKRSHQTSQTLFSPGVEY
jgi:hypothetical protein